MQSEPHDSYRPTLDRSIKYKFLRRTISIGRCPRGAEDAVTKLLAYTKIKGLYFRQIHETNYGNISRYHHCFKGKQIDALTGLKVLTKDSSYYLNLLKHSKNLKNIEISSGLKSSSEMFASFIRRLPKGIQRIRVQGDDMETDIAQIQSLYRSLATCKSLYCLEKCLRYQSHSERAEIEDDMRNRYISKLRNLRKFSVSESDSGAQGLQVLANQGRKCSYLTGLTINSIHKPLLLSSLLFQSLRQLKIYVYVAEGVVVDQPMIQAFKSLRQLEQLDLSLPPNQEDVKILLEGLNYLPSLVRFCISLYSMDNTEQELLIQFLRKQSQLTQLRIMIKGTPNYTDPFIEQDWYVEMICQALYNKPKLKCLSLWSHTWSIETISRGLEQVKMENQLEEFEIRGFNDVVIASPLSSDSKVGGLCDFIRRQKKSLCILKIFTGPVREDETVDSIVKAIAEVEKLHTLEISVNKPDVNHPRGIIYNKMLQDIPIGSLRGCPSYQTTFVYLEQTLQGLCQLSDLRLEIYQIMTDNDDLKADSSIIFTVLPRLKNLRLLTMNLPCMGESIESHPITVLSLLELQNLVDFDIDTTSNMLRRSKMREIRQVLKQTQYKRYLRGHLSF